MCVVRHLYDLEITAELILEQSICSATKSNEYRVFSSYRAHFVTKSLDIRREKLRIVSDTLHDITGIDILMVFNDIGQICPP